jgi:hypothetical protein
MNNKSISKIEYTKSLNNIVAYHRQLSDKRGIIPFYLNYILPIKTAIRIIEESKTIKDGNTSVK